MATIVPFKAWHYNTSLDIASVVAPPYDVISPSEQEALYERSPHNVIKIELGKDEPGDHDTTNKYTRAKDFWKVWSEESVVVQDKKPGFYLYENKFLDPQTGKKRTRLVLFGLIKLEPFQSKVVLPHEKTHSGPKEDRFKLLSATQTNFSPVFGLYQDSNQTVKLFHGKAQLDRPLFSFEQDNGDFHRLWQITNSMEVSKLSKIFEGKSILIADGHHRYETALRYAEEKRNSGSSEALPSDYVLMGLVELQDQGLLIFPIHRMIQNFQSFSQPDFLNRLSELFQVKQVEEDALHQIAAGNAQNFGIQIGNESFVLKLKDEEKAKSEMPEGKPESWYDLDVTKISYLVWKRLGISEHELEKYLIYTKSGEEAINKAKSGEATLSFIVPPIRATIMREICESGELMPQKSTYFYPKLGSGFLMYHHD